jgi:GntR family transcriptional regulator
MILLVDREGTEPVYGQIARQIREQIAAGQLAPGTQLPAVRSIASDLGVNLNTVARAYRQLEAEGFVRIQQRSGAQVAAPGNRVTRGSRTELRAEFRQLLSRMRQAGLSVGELEEWAAREIGRLARREERS